MAERISYEIELDGTPELMWVPKPNMKVNHDPHLAIAIPVGDKEVINVFTCPKDHGGCGQTWASSSFRMPHLIPTQLLSVSDRQVTPLNAIHFVMMMGGRLSAEARQIMTKEAIRRGVKYILYWDDDTMPPPKGLYTMHNFMERNPHVGAVSAVYTTRENPPAPLIFKEHGQGHYWDMPMGPDAVPVPIFGAGAGFLLARIEAIVDVIERMKAANGGEEVPIWVDERIVPVSEGTELDKETRNSMAWGHDIRFCKVLNEHGWPVFGDGRVQCEHLDIADQVLYKMPEDAPGFKNAAEFKDKARSAQDAVQKEKGKEEVTSGDNTVA